MARKSYHRLKKHNRIKPNKQLEKAVLIVAITEPLMTTPQILQIYRENNTGVSVTTWVLYLGASLIWLLYGLKTRNKPLIITGTLWIIVETAVIVGVITQ